jgi:hypothetical protein
MSKKSDYSRLGFDSYQSQDIRILMSLNTKDQIQEWMDAVGPEDFEYAVGLLEIAAEMTLIEDIDAIVETDSSFIDAKIALSGF